MIITYFASVAITLYDVLPLDHSEQYGTIAHLNEHCIASHIPLRLHLREWRLDCIFEPSNIVDEQLELTDANAVEYHRSVRQVG